MSTTDGQGAEPSITQSEETVTVPRALVKRIEFVLRHEMKESSDRDDLTRDADALRDALEGKPEASEGERLLGQALGRLVTALGLPLRAATGPELLLAAEDATQEASRLVESVQRARSAIFYEAALSHEDRYRKIIEALGMPE